ncbi:MAG: hypothetical protein IJK42_14945 [Prevotella sp.]|nr:hypothetical protein [Prevotella sp.]MBQ6211044.1 hypothetical protein [Prevotella sp.]
MKRFVLFVALMAMVSVRVMADEYPYLTFEQTDGTITTIAATGTTITFNNGNLIASQDGETKTIALTDLNKMYFSATSAVRNMFTEEESDYVIYSIEGCKIGTYKNLSDAQAILSHGIYVVKKSGNTYKTIMK